MGSNGTNAGAAAALSPRLRRGPAAPAELLQFARRASRRIALPLVGAAIVTLLVGYPLLSFLALAVFPHLFGQGGAGAAISLDGFAAALTGYNLRALFNSLWIGAGAAVIGTSIGLWLSWLTSRTSLPGRRLIEAAVWAVLLLPSYFMAVGWQLLLAPGGLIDLPWLSGLMLSAFGVMVVLGLKGIPFAYLTLVAAWQALPEEIDEAGRVHGCRPLTRLRLSLGLLAPGILAAVAMIYAESLSDFGVAATLAAGVNFPLATFAIYAALDTMPLDFSLAAANSWLLLGLVLPAVWLQARVNRRAERYRVVTGRARPPRRRALGRWRGGLHAAGVALVMALALGVPIFAAATISLVVDPSQPVGWGNLSLSHYVDVFRLPEVFGALFYSARLALISALGAILLGLAVTLALMRPSGLTRLLDWGLLTIMALPGLILAAGYIFAFNQAWLPLYGSSTLLVMAYVTGSLPVTSRMLLGPVGQQHRNLHEAAAVHGLSAARRWLRVRLPLLATPLMFAFLLTASHVVFELPASELLYPPGSPPLAVALIAYLHGFNFATEAALQLTAIALVGGAVLLLRFGFDRLVPRGWQRRALEPAR